VLEAGKLYPFTRAKHTDERSSAPTHMRAGARRTKPTHNGGR